MPLAGAGAAYADPTFPPPSEDPPLDAIRSYGDMVAELEKLARTSRYPVTVKTLSEIGTQESLSEQGRELYVATVGTGDTAVWVQGRVHPPHRPVGPGDGHATAGRER